MKTEKWQMENLLPKSAAFRPMRVVSRLAARISLFACGGRDGLVCGEALIMKHKITLIPGDGIGPEVTGATISVLRATGFEAEWETFVVGAEALSRFGDPLPRDLIDSIIRNKIALKGPVATPIGTGF